MKIAIVDDVGLPNPWVERSIYTFLKFEHEVHYIGNIKNTTGIFDPKHIYIWKTESWTPEIRAKIHPYYYWMKRKINKILKKIKPDVVVGINIYAGNLVHELGYNMILADLENYGFKRSLGIGVLKGYRKYKKLFILNRIWEYESSIAEHNPIIVVTKPTYVYYKYHLGAHSVIILKAYPLKNEHLIKPLKIPKGFSYKKIRFIFIGKEISYQLRERINDPYYLYIANARIIKPLIYVFNRLYEKYKNFELIVIGDNNLRSKEYIRSVGYLDKHLDLYKYIATGHYGICTYCPSLIHIRGSINKVYMHTLLGLPVVITSTFIDVIEDLQKFASENLVWEKQEKS